MSTTTQSVEKSIVAELAFDTKTAKRVAWSEWEFTIVAPFTVEVANASYGYLKDDHTYEVMIDEKGVPVSCSCPGFEHHHKPKGRVGKHMLALATIGGPTVLEAARDFSANKTHEETDVKTETAAEKLRPDGGSLEGEANTCPNGDPKCDGPDGEDLPCFACFRVDTTTE